MDTKLRSWIKSIVWRIIGIFILGVIVYFITGSLKEMTIITLLFHGIRVILYYFHERIWEKITWGKIKHPLSELPVKNNLNKKDLKIIANKLKKLGYI